MTLAKTIHDEIDKIIKNYSKDKQKQILSKIDKIIMEDKPKPRTISTRYSIIKTKFKQHVKDKEFIAQIKPAKELTEQIIANNAKSRDSKKSVAISEEIIQKLVSYARSNDIFELAMFLLFVTGRRTSELLNATFKNIRTSDAIGIDGVKKRRDGGHDCTFIPLVSKTTFFKTYTKFKRLLKYANKNTFARTLNRRVKKNLREDLHPHVLRGVYANYSYKFRNREDKKINTFIRDALCHKTVSASMYYTGYEINTAKDIVKKNNKKYK